MIRKLKCVRVQRSENEDIWGGNNKYMLFICCFEISKFWYLADQMIRNVASNKHAYLKKQHQRLSESYRLYKTNKSIKPILQVLDALARALRERSRTSGCIFYSTRSNIWCAHANNVISNTEGKSSTETRLGLNAHRQNEMSRHPPLMCVGATEYIEFF